MLATCCRASLTLLKGGTLKKLLLVGRLDFTQTTSNLSFSYRHFKVLSSFIRKLTAVYEHHHPPTTPLLYHLRGRLARDVVAKWWYIRAQQLDLLRYTRQFTRLRQVSLLKSKACSLIRIGLWVRLFWLKALPASHLLTSCLVSLNLIGLDFKLSWGGERERERVMNSWLGEKSRK